MLLQGSQSTRRPEQPRHQKVPAQPATPPPAPTVTVRRRDYPPITWDHPSLGRTVATGLGGISRTTALLILLGAVFVGAAMAIAIVLTSIVSAFGIDASTGY